VIAEVDEWIERALAVEGAPAADRLQLLLLASWLAVDPVEVMVAMTEEAVHLAEDVGDVAAQMFALGQLGDQLLEEERAMPLREQLEEAVALAPRANHPVYLASVLSNLANVLLRRRAFDEVRRLLEGFFVGGTAQFGLLEANVIYQAARAALMAGDLDRAAAGFAAAEDAAIRTASPIGLAFAAFGKGTLAFARGDLVEARRWHEQNVEMMTLAAPRGALLGHYLLAVLCAAQGDGSALAAHAAALEDARAQRVASPRQRERRYFAYADVASGLVALADGRVADAEPLFLAAIETRATVSLADAVDGLTACATARGDETRATMLAELAAGVRDGSRSVDSVAGAVA
jgi:tetratricopeptide (TPR) repeat protein